MRRLLLLLPLLFFPGCVQGWVSPTGLDSNPGTESQPKRTFAGACAMPNDSEGRLIIVKAGVYPEQQIPASCSQTMFVGQGNPVVRASSPSNNESTLGLHGSDIELRNFTLDSNALKRKTLHINGNRVRLVNMNVGNANNDKAIEVWGDDVRIQNSNIHDARILQDGVHTECIFVVGANRLWLTDSKLTGCGVYDVAFTRCTWCAPEEPAGTGGVIERNTFYHSLQLGGNWHYEELAFYAAMGEVRGYRVVGNSFETRASDKRGGILLEPPWVSGVRCGNKEFPSPNLGGLETEWKVAC